MADTVTINIDTDDWTNISVLNGPEGFFTNESGHIIKYKIAAIKPAASDTFGHALYPRISQNYAIQSTETVWARGTESDSRVAISGLAFGPDRKFTKEFFREASLGRIPGYTTEFFAGVNNSLDAASFQDVWDVTSTRIMTLATSPETWEIVSDDAADAVTGTGARTVVIPSLDGSLVEQVNSVNLNGLTPVTVPSTHLRPFGNMVVIAFGSGQQNVGTITLTDQATGDVRLNIIPTRGLSQSSHFTVPSNKELEAVLLSFYVGKNDEIEVRSRIRIPGPDSGFISGGELPVYQNSLILIVQSPIPLFSGIDFKFQAQTVTGQGRITTFGDFLMVDKTIIETIASHAVLGTGGMR